MKNRLLLFVLCAMIFSCKKKDVLCDSIPPGTVAPAAETAYLQNYLTANSLTATAESGMFYTISNPGSGTSPNLCSSITCNYTGTIISGTTDGVQFDASGSTPATFTLNALIDGWQLILPKLKTGGSVTLYIPPTLGYGPQARTGLPANSYLKFVITLVSVQ